MRVLQLRKQASGRAVSRPVRRLCFNSDGSTLVGRLDGASGLATVAVHSKAVPELPEPITPRPTCAAFSLSGEYFAVGDIGGTSQVFRLIDGRSLAELRPEIPFDGIAEVAFAPTTDPRNQWLAVCGIEFWLWNPLTQQYLIAPEREHFRSAAFDPSGDAVFARTGEDTLRFRLKPFAEEWRVPVAWSGPRFNWNETARVRVSADGAAVATTSGAAVATILDPNSGRSRQAFGFPRPMTDFMFVPNSRLLAIADGSPTIRVYDTDTGTIAREYDWGIGNIHCVTFSNDGAMGAAGGDKGKIVVWDVE